MTPTQGSRPVGFCTKRISEAVPATARAAKQLTNATIPTPLPQPVKLEASLGGFAFSFGEGGFDFDLGDAVQAEDLCREVPGQTSHLQYGCAQDAQVEQ